VHGVDAFRGPGPTGPGLGGRLLEHVRCPDYVSPAGAKNAIWKLD